MKLQQPRTIEEALLQTENPQVITEACRPYRILAVNQAWCDACGYTSEEAVGQTAELLPELNKALLELEPLICCPDCCTEGGVSYDDIDLWARLRSLTIIKGVELPPKVRAYLDNFEAKGDVPLYDTMAV